MADFVMPSLGADMESGVLVEWHKQPGDSVRRGDVIAEVETDKGIIAVETFTSGILEDVRVQPGERVAVGTVLAKIREEDAAPATSEEATEAEPGEALVPQLQAAGATRAEGTSPPAAGPPPAARGGVATKLEPHSSIVAPARVPPSRIAISPSARRLARQLGVDPATVRGTGRGGIIHRADVERAAEASKQELVSAQPAQPPLPTPARPTPDTMQRMRRAIAAAMSRSKREIPHYYLSTTIDVQRAVDWLEEQNANRSIVQRIIPAALFLKATALALRTIPELNALWKEDHAEPRDEIHVGAAIALRGGGLVAPALHHTDRLNLDQLTDKLRDLTERARRGGLRSSELSDATITVTSLGERGVDTVYGVIYPPQVALVGFGKIVERPWSIDGGLFSRKIVTVTLSGDHRASDGHRGGLFLNAIERLLQEPEKL